MAQFSELNRVAIAEICVYTSSLFIAILLSIRHGFGRSSGWMYLILFSVMRILGSGLQLGTINDLTNVSLYIGANTLQSIGLSPLILTMLGLLSRVLGSIRQNRTTLITPGHIRLVQILVLVGLVMGVVGGSKMGSVVSRAIEDGNRNYAIPGATRAGLALTISGYGILTVATSSTGFQVRSAEPGEKRLLLANALALPFVLVKVVYSCLATYTTEPNFRGFGGSIATYTNYLLGMSVIMEMAAVAIIEGIGLTLQWATVGQKEAEIPLGTVTSPPTYSSEPVPTPSHYQESGVERV